MLAEYLPLKDLQAVLPVEQIRELQPLLATVDPRPGYDPISDKKFLAKLYDAYYGVELLRQQKHRRKLLEYVPETRLRELARAVGVDDSGTFADVLGRVGGMSWKSDEPTKAFLEFFGYPVELLPEQDVKKPTLQEITPYGPPLKMLYDYQASVHYRCLAELSSPCARVMVQMPTGSGKTRTAMEVIAAFLNASPERSVLWLAHTEELCEQAVEAFAEVWRHVGQHAATLARCWGSYEPDLPVAAPSFIVGGFSKLHSLRTKNAPSPEVDLVIVDEAHMVVAPTYSAVVDWAKSLSARVLGLSATPARSSGSEELVDYFNGRIVEIEEAEEGVIEFLQGRGILADLEREQLRTNLTFSLTAKEWEYLEEELEYPKELIKRIAENHERNGIIAQRLWKLAEEGKNVLVFAGSLDQSKLLCALMLYRDIPAAHIDGSTHKETRHAAIAKFRRQEIRFLFNYQVLTTGFDAPAVDTIVIARPTRSLVLYSQMIGRGLRGPAVGGTASVQLIDVVDDILDYSGRLDTVYDYFAGYWSD